MVELMKDYDISINYHLGKANVVADALSQKATGELNALTMEYGCLHKEMAKLELEVVSRGIEGLCATISAEPIILEEIKIRQWRIPNSRRFMITWRRHRIQNSR